MKYKINPATVGKGFNILVDEGVIYKKRGVGMFVSKGSKELLMNKRKESFFNDYIVTLLDEAKKLNISIEDIIVIYDDISLNLGKIRFRESGTSGGHNGIKSIIKVLGGENKFHRLKIGIGPQTKPSEQYVLESFSDQELLLLKDVCKIVKNALEYYLDFGIQKAQNKYN